MANREKIDEQASAKAGEPAAQANDGPQRVPKDVSGPNKASPNPHHEHQDQHGSGEGLTGMQPGAGHPRGR